MALPSQLTQITVEGLFGENRSIEIALDRAAPTVLTGANGTGKSTILRLVHAASMGNVDALSSAPLHLFRLEFEDGPAFQFLRDEAAEIFEIKWGGHIAIFETSPNGIEDVPVWAADAMDSFKTSPEAPSIEAHVDRVGRVRGIPMNHRRLILDQLRRTNFHRTSYESPDWLADFAELFPVLFIGDQRLTARRRTRPTMRGATGRQGEPSSSYDLAVDWASNHIRERMNRVDSAYARESLLRDRRFPREVIFAMQKANDVPMRELNELIDSVNDRRATLRNVGLLEADREYEPDLTGDGLDNPSVRPVISAFLKSTRDKLDVFEGVADRLTALKGFLDERFAPKQLRLTRDAGVQFALPTEQVISARQLSSGEQQMFVLAFEILFRADEGTLVIIDEPEISLHVKWQDTLIDHLRQMGAPSGLQYLMATHSPMLLASHPELERSLDIGE